MVNYYATKNQGSWTTRREHAVRSSGTFKTQAQAVSYAKQLCHNSGGGEVRIQGRNGKFTDSDTVKPGNDPMPPRDGKH